MVLAPRRPKKVDIQWRDSLEMWIKESNEECVGKCKQRGRCGKEKRR